MGGATLITWSLLALVTTRAPGAAHLTVSVEHRVTTVTAGDDVSLRCNIRTEGALRQVSWYKVLDGGATRQKIFSYETFWPLNGSRPTSRQIVNHQATVWLADVTLRDHGPYHCHVSVYDRSLTLEATGHVFLNVMVPPSSIALIAAESPAAFDRYEARNFTLVCIVAGGKPAPTVRFKRDGAIVEAQAETASPSSLVTAPHAARTDEGPDGEPDGRADTQGPDGELDGRTDTQGPGGGPDGRADTQRPDGRADIQRLDGGPDGRANTQRPDGKADGGPDTWELNGEEQEDAATSNGDGDGGDQNDKGDHGDVPWIDVDDTKPEPATPRPGETYAHSRGPGARAAPSARPQADGGSPAAPLQPPQKSQGVVAPQAKVLKEPRTRLVVSLHEEPVYFLHQGEVPVSDGTVEVRARLTWLLSPTLDDLALFSCEVQHPALSMAMQLERTLTAPKGLRIEVLPRRPLVGRTVRFSVDFQREVFPEPLYTWTRIGGPLPDGQLHTQGPLLLLENVGASLNGSMFRCSAENALGSTDIHTRLIIYEHAAPGVKQRPPSMATGGATLTQDPLRQWMLVAVVTLALGT